ILYDNLPVLAPRSCRTALLDRNRKTTVGRAGNQVANRRSENDAAMARVMARIVSMDEKPAPTQRVGVRQRPKWHDAGPKMGIAGGVADLVAPARHGTHALLPLRLRIVSACVAARIAGALEGSVVQQFPRRLAIVPHRDFLPFMVSRLA